jgi:hypothetical protein
MRTAAVTIEEAIARLVILARANGGSVGAADIEADAGLACDPLTACAAAMQLALEVDIVPVYTPRRSTWFPFDRLLLRTIGPTVATQPPGGRRATQDSRNRRKEAIQMGYGIGPALLVVAILLLLIFLL